MQRIDSIRSSLSYSFNHYIHYFLLTTLSLKNMCVYVHGEPSSNDQSQGEQPAYEKAVHVRLGGIVTPSALAKRQIGDNYTYPTDRQLGVAAALRIFDDIPHPLHQHGP